MNLENSWVKKVAAILWDAIVKNVRRFFWAGLIGAIERYKERTGHYPICALADKFYRNRGNLA